MVRRIRVNVRRTVSVRTRVQVWRTLTTRAHVAHTATRSAATTARSLPPYQARPLVDEGFGPIDDPGREFDPFLSHASEDKEFTTQVADALVQRRVRVWFDKTETGIGNSIRESVDRGLARSRFGVAVFSHSFFAKKWTNYELNGLVTREVRGRKVILPVWHPGFTFDDLVGYSPSLADKKALEASSLSIDEIADQLASLVLRPE